jgi:hypothetical protein
MSEKGRVFENLSGPLKPSQKSEARVDGVVGLGETGPEELSGHTAEVGSSSVKSGEEAVDAGAQGYASKNTDIARRSASHPLENPSAGNK